MKAKKNAGIRLLLWLLVLLLAAPVGPVRAQDAGGQMIFRQEELDQMLAPIALYPDELLVQILVAATYPLEVVQALRWFEANPNLGGDYLALGLEQQNWDPSVKSLISFPTVLQMMNDRIEWTQMLGDAFLAQEGQVMDTIQRLRQRAHALGYLRTTGEQTVVTDPQQGIIIEPAMPQTLYVPIYDPLIVYGPWWWPTHRPFYYYPRSAAIRSGVFGLGIGVTLGAAWGYAWGGFNWHRHSVIVNTARHQNLNRHIDRKRYGLPVGRGGPSATWRHDPVHRLGVAYRSPSEDQRYGRGPLPGAQTRRDFRGFDGGTRMVETHGTGGRGVAQKPPTVPRVQTNVQPTKRSQASAVHRPVMSAPEKKIESPKETSGPARRPGIPEQPVQTDALRQQPRVPASGHDNKRPEGMKPPVGRTPTAVQGTQGPTAFGGQESGSQVRQFGSRGRESLGAPPVAAWRTPAVDKPPRVQAPAGGAQPQPQSGGLRSRENAGSNRPQGGSKKGAIPSAH